MKPDARILDRNIRRLLREAYVPALPAPEYRKRLLGTFLEEVGRRGGERRLGTAAAHATGAREPLTVLRFSLAAAAALLLALAAFTWLRSTTQSPLGREALLAEGRVALLFAEEEHWRSASVDELRNGLRLMDSSLELAVPDESSLTVQLETGEVRVAGSAGLRLRNADGLLHGTLFGGPIEVAREAAGDGSAWSLDVPPGNVAFFEGELSARLAGDRLELSLEHGRARYESPVGAHELVEGTELLVIAGRPQVPALVARKDADPPDEPGESRAAVEVPVDPAPVVAPNPARARLVGLARAADGSELTGFRVALLRKRRGNSYGSSQVVDYPAEGEQGTGAFTWEDIRPDTYRIFVHAEGRALVDFGYRELAPGDTLEVEAVLQVGASIRGFVLDEEGLPVADALVLSENDTPQDGMTYVDADRFQWLPISTRTRSDGSFELLHLRPGTHALRTTQAGHAPTWSLGVEVAEHVPTELEIALAAGGSVEGRVTRPDGTPWEGAHLIITLTDRSQRPVMSFVSLVTDAEGRYRADDLPAERQLVVFIDPAHPERPVVEPVEVTPVEAQRVDFLHHIASTRVSGVLSSADGNPHAFQNMALFSLDALMRGDTQGWKATGSADDGTFVIRDVSPGPHLLFLVHEFGRSIHLASFLDVPAVAEFETDVRLSSARVAGRVRDGRNGEPLQDVDLMIEALDPISGRTFFAGNGTANAEGRFEFSHLPPGRFWVTAYDADRELGFQRSAELRVEGDGTVEELDLQLLPGATLVVEVLDSAGAPVSGARVRLLDEERFELLLTETTTTDGEGLFVIPAVRPGAYVVEIGVEGVEPVQRRIVVTEPGEARFHFAVSATKRSDESEQEQR